MKKIMVLESLRGLAALYIFLAHFSLSRFSLDELHEEIPAKFGQEAVMLFFLLSGFVIHVSSQRSPNLPFRAYFQRRALRIYPVYLFALLVSYLVACLNAGQILSFDLMGAVGHFFMLQDLARGKPGIWFETFYGNIALWSLSYEWWFYMLFFPIARYVEAQTQKWVVAALAIGGHFSYLIFPTPVGLFLNYFMIWWIGVEAARLYCNRERPTLGKMKIPLGMLALCTLLHLFVLLSQTNKSEWPLEPGLHPLLEFRHFLFSLVIVLVVLLLPARVWGLLRNLLSPFATLAPISYALYLLHYPLGCLGNYLAFIEFWPLRMAGYFVITLAVSHLAEFVLQKRVVRSAQRLASPAA